MHHQEIVPSNVTSESESNTPSDSTTNLINADNLSETSRIPSPSISPNSNGDTSVEPFSNQDEDQKLSTDNSLSSDDLSGWSVVASWRKDNFQMNEHQLAYLENMYASEIFPRVYLGSQMAATDKAWLEDHNITHILTVCNGIKPAYPESYTYKTISVRDNPSQNLMVHFDTTYKFIQSALKQEKGNILVHCHIGISRSPTVTIAYIMKSRKMSFDDAFDLVRSNRPVICPNLGFRQQLKLYESLGCQRLRSNPKYWGFLVKKWGDRLLLSRATLSN